MRDLLELELHKLEFQLHQKIGDGENEHGKPDTVTKTTASKGPQMFTEKITNYGLFSSNIKS